MRHLPRDRGERARADGGRARHQPSDLTQLAAREGGSFPVERVVKRIDGRDPLVSHGSPMPVYGFFFEGRDKALKTPSGQPILTSQPIIDLIAHLQTLQAE